MISKIDRGLSHFKRPMDTLDCCVGSGQAMSYPLLSPPPAAPRVGGKRVLKETSVAGHIRCQAPIGLYGEVMQLSVNVAS